MKEQVPALNGAGDNEEVIIQAKRLELISSTIETLDAELASRQALADNLGLRVPESWPPGEYDRAAIQFFRQRAVEDPNADGWYGWYGALREDETASGVLVGAGGYFGPPSLDGTVEIGYSILPEYCGRGFATEMAGALVSRACALLAVRRVIAHTFPDNAGSITVLENCGFAFVGPGAELGTIQFELARQS